jgi:hypothetical protein
MNVIPLGMKAPKLWPAEPLKRMRIVSSGRPFAPHFFVTSPPVMVPTTRCVFWMGISETTFSPRSIAGLQRSRSTVRSSDFSRPWSCGIWQKRPTLSSTSGW